MRRADTDYDFKRFNVDRDRVLPHEDALRIPGSPKRSVEWWYFDATLTNGAAIVVVFSTKPFGAAAGELAPEVRISIRDPHEGISFDEALPFDPASFEASRFDSGPPAGCSVHFGKDAFLYGDLDDYHVLATNKNVSITMVLHREEVPPVRIGTGHLLFDAGGKEYLFGWIAPVPFGSVEVKYTVGGKSYLGTGIGYHDHNWSNDLPIVFAHDWYWGNARLGNFTIVASHVTAQAAFDRATESDLVLFENDKQIACGSAGVTFSKSQPTNDSLPGAPFSGLVRYEFVDGETKYTVTFKRVETIYTNADFPPVVYRRFLGPCTLELSCKDKTESLPISEFMWLGDVPPGL